MIPGGVEFLRDSYEFLMGGDVDISASGKLFAKNLHDVSEEERQPWIDLFIMLHVHQDLRELPMTTYNMRMRVLNIRDIFLHDDIRQLYRHAAVDFDPYITAETLSREYLLRT